MLQQIANWLYQTSPSILLRNHQSWTIPTVQSIHIVAIGIVVISVLAIDLRVLGVSGRDQTLVETTNRFFPWLTWALVTLLITGALMVLAEPPREFLTFSFWAKM